ncbi:MAG: hypothetical protein IPF85_24800 [Anaerolineae bacterium]|nr:hypothetical protein [Anaerolineae bacterium]
MQAMGNDVVQALNQALLVWQTDDLNLAREVVSSDYRINQERMELEERCTQLIAVQAPVARSAPNSGRADHRFGVGAHGRSCQKDCQYPSEITAGSPSADGSRSSGDGETGDPPAQPGADRLCLARCAGRAQHHRWRGRD